MSARSGWLWGYLFDSETAKRVERAADTLLNGFHRRVEPLIAQMNSDASQGNSVTLEKADEYLLAMNDIVNYVQECCQELFRLNFDNNSRINGIIMHIQVVAHNGVFDAMELLKEECKESEEPEFSSAASARVVQVLQNTVDYVDIAGGEAQPRRLQEDVASILMR